MTKFAGEVLGRLLTLLGYDGTEFRNITVGTDGHVHVDVKVSVLPTGAATQTTLAWIRTLLGELSGPTGGSVNQQLGAAVTALQLIDNLVGALGSVNTDDLQVDVKTSSLPTGAATQTTLAGIQALIGALSNPDAGTMNRHLTDAVTALELIDDLRKALYSVSQDMLLVFPGYTGSGYTPLGTDADLHVQTDIITSALPTGAATATHQTTLQTKVDELYGLKWQGDHYVGKSGGVSVPNAEWAFMSSNLVPSGKTWYLYHATVGLVDADVIFRGVLNVGGVNVMYGVNINGSLMWRGGCLAKATEGQTVRVGAYQLSGAAKDAVGDYLAVEV